MYMDLMTIRSDCLIQSKKAKGRAPANDRQYKDSERSVEDDYCLSGWSSPLSPTPFVSHPGFRRQGTITV